MSRRYEILRKIGSGGQGEVFLVRDRLRQNKPLALKRLHPGTMAPAELASEFERLAELRHPNLARAYDFGEDSVGPFFTSEYIEGPGISDWAKQATEEEILLAAMGLLRALALIHDRDLVHGDVSPSNVIISRNGENGARAKLLDLGGALRPGQFGAATTPGYAAPEVLTNRGALTSSDLYSFGVLLASILFARHPFGEGDASQTVERQLSGRFDLPDPNVVPIAGLCRDLLQTDPASRPQSAGAVLDRIGELTDAEVAVRFADLHGGELPAPKIVGRNVELSALKGLVDQLDDPRGQRVAFVTGKEGSGRSTILSEIIRHAQLSGLQVIGQANVPGRAGSLLSELFARAEGGCLPEASKRILAPWIRKAETEDLSSVNISPDAVGYAAVDALTEASAKATIMIVIDDISHGEELLRSVALTLARSLAEERKNRPEAILVVAGLSADFDNSWRALSPLPTHLGPLDKRDVDELVASMMPGISWPRELADSAFHASKGLPGLAEQFVRQAAGSEGVLDGEKYALQMVAGVDPRVREILGAMSLLEGACSMEVAGQLGLTSAEAERLSGDGYLFEVSSSREPGTREPGTREPGFREPGFRVPVAIGRAARSGLDGERLKDVTGTLGRILETTGRLREAAELFEKSGSPDKAIVAWCSLANQYLEQGNLGGASDCFERASGIDPLGQQFPAYGENAFQTWRSIGRYDLALRGLDALDLDDRAKHCLKAELVLNQGKHREALALAKGIERDDEIDMSLSGIIAACELQLGNHETALATVVEALARRGKSEKSEHSARLAQIGGLACAYLGRFEEADSHFALANRNFEQIQDSVGQIKVLANRGFVERRRGNLNKAHSLYDEAISLSKNTGDRAREGLNLMNRATISLVTGNIGSAHEDYLAALDIAVVSGNGFARSQVEVNLADLLSGLGNHSEALKLAGQALERCRVLGQGRLETRALLISGIALYRAGATHRAERRLKEARRRFAAAGDDVEVLSTDLHLAELNLQQGKYREAQALAETVLDSIKENTRGKDRARALAIKARAAAIEGGRLEEPLELLAKAVAIIQKESLPDDLWRIMVHQAQLQKRADLLLESEDTLKKARDVFDRILEKVPAPYIKSYCSAGEAARLPPGDTPAVQDASESGRHAQNLERLMEINRELTREHDPKRLLSLIMEHAVELTGAERGMVVMPKAEGLEPVISYQIADEFDVSFSRSVAEKVVAEGRAILAIDAMGDDRFRAFASVHAMKLRSILAVPLLIRRRAVGVVYLDSRLRAGIFSDGDRQLLEAFGAQAAIALETARLISENAKRCEDLQQANREIRNLSVQLEERLEHNEAKLRRVGALLQKTQRDESERLKENGIVGRAPAMQQVMRMVDRIALTDVPVYVFGGSGTGKELVARALHAASERAEHPFVPVNCGALPPKLLASELFGHIRGAFTGAVCNRPGLFRLAHQGTLFLDEVVDMDPEMQAHLLRVLQDGKFRSLGGNEELSVDVRIISASNRDLEEEVRLGNFREDLFYRLNVVRIDVPALTERREDIPLLADFFVRRHGGEQAPKFARETMDILVSADWPGNVRELENEILRAITMAEPGGPITPEDLSPRFRIKETGDVWKTGGSLKDRVDVFERTLIQRVLGECEGNATQAAKQLKISRAGLYKKIEKHKIDR